MVDLDRYILFTGYIEEIYKSVQKIKAERMSAFGLRSTDTTVIAMLSQHPEGLTATELAAKCKVDKAVVSRSVKMLFEAGAVKYASDGKKNYRSRLMLDERGMEIALAMSSMARDAVAAANEGIAPEELQSFYKVLSTFNRNLKEHAKGIES
jgi:DNA-binding MarR family transcriptional regulator